MKSIDDLIENIPNKNNDEDKCDEITSIARTIAESKNLKNKR